MPSLLVPPRVQRAADFVREREAAFRRTRRDAEEVVREARAQAKEARKQLAADILDVCDELYTDLDAFLDVVAARLDLSPRTVRNALKDTFSADVLAACVDVLAEARTRVGEAA